MCQLRFTLKIDAILKVCRALNMNFIVSFSPTKLMRQVKRHQLSLREAHVAIACVELYTIERICLPSSKRNQGIESRNDIQTTY